MSSPEVQTSSLNDVLQASEEARRRALDFLEAHFAEDGSVSQDQHRVTCYRVPWALAVGGKPATASRVLAWIERSGLGDAGAFHGGREWAADANSTFNTYPETCLAYGAQLLRRFDLAQRTMEFALQFQDVETGGVYMDRDRTGADGPQLLFLTCQFGMSALMTGRIGAARAAGVWLERLWRAQPELPSRLYTVWTRSGGLVTVPPDGEDLRHYVNESQEMHQLHYNGGIAAAFLMHLYMYDTDDRWLDLARAFQSFSMQSTERQFQTKQVCKSAWGASLIATVTQEPEFVRWAARMGDWFVAQQEPDGHWDNTSSLDPDSPIQHQVEVTAEFTIHLDAVVSALSASTMAEDADC